NKYINNYNLSIENTLGLGISAPALVDIHNGVIKFEPNLKWHDKNIIDDLKIGLEIPCFLGNDAKLGAIGEKSLKENEASNLVYVEINEGIGCGIIINDEVYLGSSDNAGEYGHVVIDHDGPACHCGNYGCWETLASENFVERTWAQKTGEKRSKNEIYKLGKSGDKRAINIFNEVGTNIGLGIANIVNGLSPNRIIIGGNILKIKEFIETPIKEKAEEKSLKITFKNVDIDFSRYNGLSEVFGIGHLIIDQCLEIN
ncbi:MAG: ROK family protein, partial [Bacillota bacterium]